MTRVLSAALAVLAICAIASIASSMAAAQTVLPLPADLSLPGGSVSAIAVQGDGKVFIGGNFGKVGGAAHRNFARLNADGSVDATFQINADGTVLAIAVSGSTAYISGMFSHVGAQQRYGVAAIDIDTGTVLPWNPGAEPAYISALAIGEGTVYIGGAFETMGGASRTALAAVDATTGVALPFDAQIATGEVNALAIDNGVLYAAGGFPFGVGGVPHVGVVALDPITGTADPWTPFTGDENPFVRDMTIAGSILYLGGDLFGGPTTGWSAIAAFDITSRARLAWTSSSLWTVYHMAVAGNSMLVAGQFGPRNGFARIGLADASLEPWDPDVDLNSGIVVATEGSHAFIGGTFTHVQGGESGGFARIDVDDAAIADSPPIEAQTYLNALAFQDDGKLVIGGAFARVDGVPRHNIARLLVDGSVDPDFDPGSNGTIWALLAHGATLYASGAFSQIGGQPRSALGAIDVNTGDATAWNPTLGQSGSLPYIGSLSASDTNLYVAGEFSALGTEARSNIAAVDLSSGTVLPWSMDTDDQVIALAVANGIVFAGGVFSFAGGQPRERLAAFDGTTGSVLTWNPGADGIVSAIAVQGDSVFVGGSFALLGGQVRSAIGEIDVTAGSVSDWAPYIAAGSVYELAIDHGQLFAGGDFSSIDGQARPSIAAFDISTHELTAWSVSVDGSINPIATGADSLAFGGSFTHANGEAHNGIAVATLLLDRLFDDGFDRTSAQPRR